MKKKKKESGKRTSDYELSQRETRTFNSSLEECKETKKKHKESVYLHKHVSLKGKKKMVRGGRSAVSP